MMPQRQVPGAEAPQPRMSRPEQIEFMEQAEERCRGYTQRWLADPAFRAALHRYDRDRSRDAPSLSEAPQ